MKTGSAKDGSSQTTLHDEEDGHRRGSKLLPIDLVDATTMMNDKTGDDESSCNPARSSRSLQENSDLDIKMKLFRAGIPVEVAQQVQIVGANKKSDDVDCKVAVVKEHNQSSSSSKQANQLGIEMGVVVSESSGHKKSAAIPSTLKIINKLAAVADGGGGGCSSSQLGSTSLLTQSSSSSSSSSAGDTNDDRSDGGGGVVESAALIDDEEDDDDYDDSRRDDTAAVTGTMGSLAPPRLVRTDGLGSTRSLNSRPGAYSIQGFSSSIRMAGGGETAGSTHSSTGAAAAAAGSSSTSVLGGGFGMGSSSRSLSSFRSVSSRRMRTVGSMDGMSQHSALNDLEEGLGEGHDNDLAVDDFDDHDAGDKDFMVQAELVPDDPPEYQGAGDLEQGDHAAGGVMLANAKIMEESNPTMLDKLLPNSKWCFICAFFFIKIVIIVAVVTYLMG